MTMDEDKKWEFLQRALGAGAQGEELKPVTSKRTLFGIKSTIEQQMDDIAAEMEEKQCQKRKLRKEEEDER